MTKMLVEKGAEINSRDYRGWTPLQISCVTNHPDISRMLIEHGADVKATNRNRYTPLAMACLNGTVSVQCCQMA